MPGSVRRIIEGGLSERKMGGPDVISYPSLLKALGYDVAPHLSAAIEGLDKILQTLDPDTWEWDAIAELRRQFYDTFDAVRELDKRLRRNEI